MSTTYRTIRELARVRMLEPAMEGNYRLGSAFIEFDRMTRLTDPLLQCGIPLLSEVVHHANTPCVAVLARLYGDTVMCVADTRSTGSTVQTSYERGRPRPLLRGATSKVILAQLKSRRLNKLLALAKPETRPLVSESQFCEQLVQIRKNGYCVAHSEVDQGRVGIAVPIAISEQGLQASLSLIIDEAASNEALLRRLILLLVSSSAVLSGELLQTQSQPEGSSKR